MLADLDQLDWIYKYGLPGTYDNDISHLIHSSHRVIELYNIMSHNSLSLTVIPANQNHYLFHMNHHTTKSKPENVHTVVAHTVQYDSYMYIVHTVYKQWTLHSTRSRALINTKQEASY